MTLRWRFVVLLVVGALGLVLAAAAPARVVPHASGAASPGAADVVARLFQWPWSSVARECADVLGPAGYGAVQVSPPRRHAALPDRGYPWWQDYLPAGYQVDSRRGDRAAFAAMVAACHRAGVKVYADAVLDAAPAANRAALVDHLNDLIGLGVDGFRVDAARTAPAPGSTPAAGPVPPPGEMAPAADLAVTYQRLAEPVYLYQEIADAAGATGYQRIGDVTEHRYGRAVAAAFRDRTTAVLWNLPAVMALPGEAAVVFVDSPDAQRDGTAPLTFRDGDRYNLATAFLLAYPYGTPVVMSSYRFTGPDQGPPSTATGTTLPVACGSRWVCEHRRRTAANMVGFHNAVAGTPIVDSWSGGPGRIAFGRGNRGFVAFNAAPDPLTGAFRTRLPAGRYCDVINGDFRPGPGCTGTSYRVDASGVFRATIRPGGALALHVAAAP